VFRKVEVRFFGRTGLITDLISQSIAHLLRTNEANNRLQTDQMRTWAGILVLVLVLVCIHNVLSMLCGDHEVTTITNGCLSCK
jgi:hypothetical protein